MKYKTLLIIITICTFSFANATVFKDSILPFSLQKKNFRSLHFEDCDACGCSASGGSMGFSSVLNPNFVGIRYFNQSYSSRDGIFANSPWVDENFNTLQIWTKIPIGQKVQVSAIIPYHFHNRTLSTGEQNIRGLGDITVLAMYAIVQTQKDSSNYSHHLQIGGGIKAPTGEYESTNNLGTVNPSFQIGTGSWDYLLAAEYTFMRKQFGINMMMNYTFKSESQKHYQFGNQFNYSVMFFYYLDLKRWKLAPQIGIAGEVYDANKQYKQEIPNTAGTIVFSKIGLEVQKEKWSVGLSLMQPLHQDLSNGTVKANYRWSVNLNYTL